MSGVIGRQNVERAFRDLRRNQVPFALALGLTRTAQRIQGDVERSLPQNLDRPTPFTQRGVAIRPALKRRPVAYVFIKDIQADYLRRQETGGTRRPKKRAIVVPEKVRLNKYGNMTRGRVKKLLAREDVFSGNVRGIGGIWQRKKNGKLKLLVRYASNAQYKPKLGFEDTAKMSFKRHVFERMRSAAKFAIRPKR